MITGAHFLFYSKNAEADREFLREVLHFRNVDAGHGWLIFALPPSELAVHPGKPAIEFYLMCDDLQGAMRALADYGVVCEHAVKAGWGTSTKFRLPGGGEIGLYQPTHPLAI